jgi:hypothetical protein
MKRAAFGVQMHSGWGVLVAISGSPDAIEILARRRIVTADPEMPGAIQPYHYAMNLKLPESEKHLAKCAAASTRLAAAAIADLVKELNARQFHIVGSAVLQASGRSLPSLEKILASHPLIHTAEGEFFRHTVSRACEDLQIHVTAIRQRELEERAKSTFGNASRVQGPIASLGKTIGPPWTKDHKTAALAGALILASGDTVGWTMPADRP